MATCREIASLSSDYIDGRLGRWATMRVRLHLLMCRFCRRAFRQLRTTIAVLGHGRSTGPAPASRDALLRQFRDASRSTRGDGTAAGQE